jgi:hypothetical protein
MLRAYRQQEDQTAQRTMSLMVGESDTSLIRTETLAGREYTVVPVVALVEGVLQGANSSEPELALFAEFAKFPESWNGRPVVLRHPNVNGIYVSANSPLIFEDYHMGFMFSTKGEDFKLKTEAWLDNARIAELGGEYVDVLTRIQNGEVMNVSVGAFIDTRPTPGTYQGKQYGAVWQNVMPDHLAFLPDQVGACSVADGCGTNRVAAAAQQPDGVQVRQLSYITEGPSCCDACGKGDPCMSTQQGAPPQGEPTQTQDPPTTPNEEPTPEVLAARARAGEESLEALQRLAANALGNQVVLQDAQRLISQALPLHLNVESWACDLLAATSDVAVFMCYGEPALKGFHQIGYSVSNEGAVTFTGQPEPVNLMTKIMPRQTGGVSANAGSNEEDGAMAEIAGQGGGNTTNTSGEGTQGSGQSAPAGEPVVNAGAPAGGEAPAAPAAPLTVDAFVASLPGPIGQALRTLLDGENRRKEALITRIKANTRNQFTDDQLNGMDAAQLEPIAALAAETPSSYVGQGGFEPAFDALSVHSATPPANQHMSVNSDYLLAKPAGNA